MCTYVLHCRVPQGVGHTFEKTLVKVKKTRTCYGYETRVGLTRAKKQESQRDSTNRPKYVVDDFNVNVPNVSKSFAQTISWMPDGGSDGVNVNYVSPAWEYFFQNASGYENYNSNLLHGIPTIDADWLKLDLWSITTGANDGYDYII